MKQFVCTHILLITLVLGLKAKPLQNQLIDKEFSIYSGIGKEGKYYYRYDFKDRDWHLRIYSSYSKVDKMTYRTIQVDGVQTKLPVVTKESAFNTLTMNLNIDYVDSEVYYVSDNKILIVSSSMNWTGRMMNFSFYQLIDLELKTVEEYIVKDSPLSDK